MLILNPLARTWSADGWRMPLQVARTRPQIIGGLLTRSWPHISAGANRDWVSRVSGGQFSWSGVSQPSGIAWGPKGQVPIIRFILPSYASSLCGYSGSLITPRRRSRARETRRDAETLPARLSRRHTPGYWAEGAPSPSGSVGCY